MHSSKLPVILASAAAVCDAYDAGAWDVVRWNLLPSCFPRVYIHQHMLSALTKHSLQPFLEDIRLPVVVRFAPHPKRSVEPYWPPVAQDQERAMHAYACTSKAMHS